MGIAAGEAQIDGSLGAAYPEHRRRDAPQNEAASSWETGGPEAFFDARFIAEEEGSDTPENGPSNHHD